MNIRELQDTLQLLERMYAAGGANKQAQEISDVVQALGKHGDMTVEQFIEQVGPQLAAETSTSRSKREPAIDDRAVSRHVTDLLAALTDRTAFDAAFAAMKADRDVRIAEAGEIANGYKNTPSGADHRYRFVSKSAAFNFIFETYISRSQFDSKMDIIDRMTKWARR